MHGGLQVWKLGLGTSRRALPEVKERMRGLGSKGVDLEGRESGSKPEHFGVWRWGRRELGPGSRLGRRETRALYLLGIRCKCCVQCIVRKSSAKGTLFLNAFMRVDFFQWVHTSMGLAGDDEGTERAPRWPAEWSLEPEWSVSVGLQGLEGLCSCRPCKCHYLCPLVSPGEFHYSLRTEQ